MTAGEPDGRLKRAVAIADPRADEESNRRPGVGRAMDHKGARAVEWGDRMLGVDMGKAELHGTWRDPESQRIRWQGAVPNTAGGIRELLRRAPETALVVEPTGRYGEPLIRAAQAVGRAVLLAPPKKARAFLQSAQSRAKTDRLDSAGLALYGLTGRLRPYQLPSPAVDRVQQLLAARRGLSESLAKLRLQQASLPLAADALAPAIEALAAQVKALDARIAEAATAEELAAAVSALRTVPGIGPTIAPALAACLVSKRFTHPDQFVAYVGLDIRVHQSGKRRGQFGLSKQGDGELRRLLYLAARSAANSTHDPTFAHRYQAALAKGLPTTGALNVVARKLAKVAWSLVAHGATYDPARVGAQPPPVRQPSDGPPPSSDLRGSRDNARPATRTVLPALPISPQDGLPAPFPTLDSRA